MANDDNTASVHGDWLTRSFKGLFIKEKGATAFCRIDYLLKDLSVYETEFISAIERGPGQAKGTEALLKLTEVTRSARSRERPEEPTRGTAMAKCIYRGCRDGARGE